MKDTRNRKRAMKHLNDAHESVLRAVEEMNQKLGPSDAAIYIIAAIKDLQDALKELSPTRNKDLVAVDRPELGTRNYTYIDAVGREGSKASPEIKQ